MPTSRSLRTAELPEKSQRRVGAVLKGQRQRQDFGIKPRQSADSYSTERPEESVLLETTATYREPVRLSKDCRRSGAVEIAFQRNVLVERNRHSAIRFRLLLKLLTLALNHSCRTDIVRHTSKFEALTVHSCTVTQVPLRWDRPLRRGFAGRSQSQRNHEPNCARHDADNTGHEEGALHRSCELVEDVDQPGRL